ncbi:GAD-like domain-containing protein [Brucella cytisi]|uniref:GAD-like domain-containing protein n=2 Tax=Bacteria TaxID=2 RepID=UPI0035DEDFB2
MLSQTFGELIGGKIDKSLPIDDRIASSVVDFFPPELAGLYKEVGVCSIKGGRLQLCDPADFRGVLALVFGADKQFSHNNCHAFAYSAFGTLYCWSKEFALVIVDLINGEITSRGALGKIKPGAKIENQIYVPFSLSDDALDLIGEDGRMLFSRANAKLGTLEIGECYGFFPALALGGACGLEYLKRVVAPEHFAIIAQTLEFKLVDVQADGTARTARAIG